MNNREFSRNDKVWSLEFTCDTWPASVNPIKLENGIATVNRLETSEMTKLQTQRICHKIQDDINNLHIEFSNKEDNSVQNWMRQWIEHINENFKEQEEGLLKWFKFSDDEQHPGAISMVLKKPLSELTEDDKKELIEWLKDVTNLDEEKILSVFS